MAPAKDIVLVFKSQGMGSTQEQGLKDKLTGTFLSLINDPQMLPRAICFYTDGVYLACDGSPILEALQALEQKGVHLILCQTCLDYFGLRDQVRVGIVGGMGDIVTAMWQADTVISL
ncbi:MAG: DsrE family protein [Anaerolineales bacterium]|jgi:sulfur relay (sulfurtransferase) complex TusBCD TusD component (DsrE family)